MSFILGQVWIVIVALFTVLLIVSLKVIASTNAAWCFCWAASGR